MAPQFASIKKTSTSPDSVSAVLEERRTPELVIGLVGAVASGVTTSGRILEEILREEYGYQIHYHTVSEIISESAHLVSGSISSGSDEGDRIQNLQGIGNRLRQKLGNDYLIEKCIERINTVRSKSGVQKAETEGAPDKVLPKRFAHIIDSIKNPAEVEQLHQVYGEMFWLFGVFSPEDVRKVRLQKKGAEKDTLDGVIQHDQNEEENFGQKVRDTIERADFFIRNDKENDEALRESISRYLEILFNAKIHTPTVDETAMYEAQSAAANSACMSRQVGAAIYGANKELLAVGWNDVPKAGGGLYGSEDQNGDHRCYKWGGKLCHNDDNKKKIKNIIFDSINAEAAIRQKAAIRDVKEIISKNISKNKEIVHAALAAIDSLERVELFDRVAFNKIAYASGIDSLIEFSRAVHAGMDAIIAAARNGRGSLLGATIFCTTFPCHSCARHIVASGISKVVYIEPYPKSKAYDLHSDAICLDDNLKGDLKVRFVQYEGVAPKNILRLFKSGAPRKKDGFVIQSKKKDLLPIFSPPIDGFAANEMLVVNDLIKKEKAAKVDLHSKNDTSEGPSDGPPEGRGL